MNEFIELTIENTKDKVLVHYTRLIFIKIGNITACTVEGKFIEESFDEIKSLIQNVK